MKKFILLLIIFLITHQNLKAQNAFYDAIKIAQLLNKNADSNTIKEAISTSLSYFQDDYGNVNYGAYFRIMDKKVTDKIAYLTLTTNNVEKICELSKSALEKNRSNSKLTEINNACKIVSENDVLKSQFKIQSVSLDSEVNKLQDSLNTLKQDLQSKNKTLLWRDSVKDHIKLDTAFTNKTLEEIETIKIDTARLNISINQKQADKDIAEEKYKKAVNQIQKLNIDIQNKFKILLSDSAKLFKDENLMAQFTIAKSELKNSQRLTDNLDVFNTKIKNDDIISSGSGSETTTLTNFKMPSQSEMIDALAIYIARRFKQEMALSLIEELRKSINKQQLLKELFPETIKLFNNNDAFELPRFGKIWNHSISEDFIKLPDNIKASKYLQNQAFKTKSEKEFAMFKDLVTIANWIIEKNALPEIVSLYKTDTTTIESAPIKQSLEVMNIVNNELYDIDTLQSSQYWISWKKLERLKPIEFEIFLNLLEIKYDPIFKMLAIKNPSTWGNRTSANTIQFKNYLTKILLTLNNFQSSQRQYLNKLEKDPSIPYTGVNFWDFEKNLFSIVLNKEIINLPERTEQILTVIDRTTGLYKLLEEKNYAAMVHESMAILEDVLPVESNRLNELMVKNWKLEKTKFQNEADPFLQKMETLKNNYADDINAIHQDYVASNKSKKDFFKTLEETKTYKYFTDSLQKKYKNLLVVRTGNDFKNTMLYFAQDPSHLILLAQPAYSKSRFLYVTKTAEFLTDVMSAANSKQLANVMEAYGMPPNSYKIKRSSRFTVELNAYVGAFGGYEFIAKKNNVSNTKTTDASPVYGISVPVGVSASWGSHSKAKNASSSLYLNKRGALKDLSGNSFSLSLTIIDLTAVVTYRLEKGENEALPKEVKWSQILSPGLHARWGIRNTPLCFSTGLQYTPQLRNLSDKTASQQAWRVYGGLFFDLPLYNLYRR